MAGTARNWLLLVVFACAALGLCVGSLTFRARSISVFADAISAALLLVTGANVPLERLPDGLQSLSDYIPLTNGLHAARALATGAPLTDALPQIRDEFLELIQVGAHGMILGGSREITRPRWPSCASS